MSWQLQVIANNETTYVDIPDEEAKKLLQGLAIPMWSTPNKNGVLTHYRLVGKTILHSFPDFDDLWAPSD